MDFKNEDKVVAAFQAANWNNDKFRRAVSLKILRKVSEVIEKEDLVSDMCDVEYFPIGSTPQFTETAGLKAYRHARGAIVPESFITQRTNNLIVEPSSVLTSLELGQLKSGRYGSIADIRKLATEALLNRRYAAVWNTFLWTITPTAPNAARCPTGRSDDNKKTFLDSGLSWLHDNSVGGPRAIIGRYSAVDWIANITGYSDQTKREVEVGGVLGSYRGVPVIYMKNFKDGYGQTLITGNNIMIAAKGSGKFGITERPYVLEGIRVRDGRWEIRFSEEWGILVFHANHNYRIKFTG